MKELLLKLLTNPYVQRTLVILLVGGSTFTVGTHVGNGRGELSEPTSPIWSYCQRGSEHECVCYCGKECEEVAEYVSPSP
jgi:hypothetical protein